ncbi:MAG: hypothetical protein A2Z03_03755 [Chloroflexi bacterium RBG_16_56_8]|nr:MAG: hypothetical protein A2Z03_03755 [Chloroflexi bacterium RBG_16_56_8]
MGKKRISLWTSRLHVSFMHAIILYMKWKLTAPAIVLVAGLVTTGIAVFANALGLDQHPGWGRVRIAALVLGIFMALCVALYYRYTEKVLFLTRKFRSFIEAHPVVSPLRGNQAMVYLSGLYRNYGFTLPVFILVILTYIWFISSGTWTTWISPTRYYADLARGFLKGQLYLPTKVDPNLLEMSDPYDLTERIRLGIQMPMDVSLYKGRYYLYWGPVPALALILVNPFIQGRVGDLFLVFGFVCGIFLLQFLLVVTLWDRYFHNLPRRILGFSIFLVGLAGPVTFMLNNFHGARIYEAAVSGGQFFLMGGFMVALTALTGPPSGWRFAFAGIFWALAIGTRLTMALPSGIMVLLVVWWILRSNYLPSMKIKNLIALGLPLAVGFMCLGWYNWARFGSPTESGLYYQMPTGVQEHYDDLFGLIYVVQNLYNYLLHPFIVRPQFPFIFADSGKTTAIFSSYPLPGLYGAQQITGLLCSSPFVLFAIGPVWGLFSSPFRKRRADSFGNDTERKFLNWITFSLSGSFLVAFGILLAYSWVAMRFLEDFMPSLILLSVIGFWQGYQFLSRKPTGKRLYTIFGIALASASILISTLLAISTNDARFELIRLFTFPK